MRQPGVNLDDYEDHIYDIIRYMFHSGDWFAKEKKDPGFVVVAQSTLGYLMMRTCDGKMFIRVFDERGSANQLGPLTAQELGAFRTLSKLEDRK